MSVHLPHKNLVAGRSETAHAALSDLAPGVSLHGLTDGTWSLIDAIRVTLDHIGTISCLTVSTWTANQADISSAYELLSDKRVKDVRFLIDRSFQTRQPGYCQALRERFGDGAIRVWNSHAKFVLFQGGAFDVLYLTSANLNQNRRIENFTAICGDSIPGQYANLISDLFKAQKPSQGFLNPKVGRHHTSAVFGKLSKEHPEDKSLELGIGKEDLEWLGKFR